MEYLSSVALAFILSCVGVFVFREPQSADCGPLVSCLIFQTAIAILLLHMCLYPKSLRRLPKVETWFYELLLSLLLFELFLHDVWFPLESSTLRLLPYLADYDEVFENWTSSSLFLGVFDVLRWEGTGVVVSYLMSLEFLLAVMHATRLIDLTVWKCSYMNLMCNVRKKIDQFKCEMDYARKILKGKTRNMRKICSKCKKNSSSSSEEEFSEEDEDDDNEDEPCFERLPVPCKPRYNCKPSPRKKCYLVPSESESISDCQL